MSRLNEPESMILNCDAKSVTSDCCLHSEKDSCRWGVKAGRCYMNCLPLRSGLCRNARKNDSSLSSKASPSAGSQSQIALSTFDLDDSHSLV